MLKLKLSPYSDTANPPRKEMLWIPSFWRKCWLLGFTGKFGTREFNHRTRIERISLTLALGRIFCFFPRASVSISYFMKVTTSISFLSFSILSCLFLARSFRMVLTPLQTRLSSPLGFLPVEPHALFTPAITLLKHNFANIILNNPLVRGEHYCNLCFTTQN